MADIIKTWPSSMSPKAVASLFSENARFAEFYFSIGKGKPKQQIERIWFTYQGRVIGYVKVKIMAVNDGSFPRLRQIDTAATEWHIKKDYHVAICGGPFKRSPGRVYFAGFRGWRYFDFKAYRSSPEAGMRF